MFSISIDPDMKHMEPEIYSSLSWKSHHCITEEDKSYNLKFINWTACIMDMAFGNIAYFMKQSPCLYFNFMAKSSCQAAST